MERKVNSFISSQPQERRVIFDRVCSVIFQTFPNIKERVSKDKLKYIDAERGSVCSLYVKKKIVYIEFRSGIKFAFDSLESINVEHIETYLQK